MRFASMLAAAAICLASISFAHGQAPKGDPRRDLDIAIPEMIRLLEAKDYVPFIRAYMPPDQLKTLEKAGKIEEVVQAMPVKVFAAMLRQLKGTQSVTPMRAADGAQVTYAFAKPIEGATQVKFIKLGEFWYIK